MIIIQLLVLIIVGPARANNLCSAFTPQLMRIIECINVKRQLIYVTILTKNSTRNLHAEDFVNKMIPNLLKLQIPYFIQLRDLNYEYEVIDYSELFSWTGEKFEIRKTQINKTITYAGLEAAHPGRYIKDVTSSATILVTEDIHNLHEYLVGSVRSPFYNPSSVFNIFILEKPDEADIKVRQVLGKLWRSYGIIIAVLLFTCEQHVSLHI